MVNITRVAPTRVRELKPKDIAAAFMLTPVAPTRVRELKPYQMARIGISAGRTHTGA